MLSGEIEAPLVVSIMHVAFSIVMPPYSVMGGMYYISRVRIIFSFLHKVSGIRLIACIQIFTVKFDFCDMVHYKATFERRKISLLFCNIEAFLCSFSTPS